MSDAQSLFLHQIVRVYLSSCEGLLSAAVMPTDAQFTQDELHLIEYYTAEVTKIVLATYRSEKQPTQPST